jgi:hypothetical protein
VSTRQVKIPNVTSYNELVIELGEGQVTTRGKDWPQPSGRNMADYVTSNGRFDSLTFFNDHKRYFPTSKVKHLEELLRWDAKGSSQNPATSPVQNVPTLMCVPTNG